MPRSGTERADPSWHLARLGLAAWDRLGAPSDARVRRRGARVSIVCVEVRIRIHALCPRMHLFLIGKKGALAESKLMHIERRGCPLPSSGTPMPTVSAHSSLPCSRAYANTHVALSRNTKRRAPCTPRFAFCFLKVSRRVWRCPNVFLFLSSSMTFHKLFTHSS